MPLEIQAIVCICNFSFEKKAVLYRRVALINMISPENGCGSFIIKSSQHTVADGTSMGLFFVQCNLNTWLDFLLMAVDMVAEERLATEEPKGSEVLVSYLLTITSRIVVDDP